MAVTDEGCTLKSDAVWLGTNSATFAGNYNQPRLLT